MPKLAIFTGAGASRAIGYPLTKELLPRVRAELIDGSLFRDLTTRTQEKVDRKHLLKYLVGLLPGFDIVASDDLPLITDVFSLVEHALVAGESLPIGGEADLRRMRDLLKQAITDILLGEYLRKWNKSEADRRAQLVIDQLVTFIEAHGGAVGIISTNYDIGIDRPLYDRMTAKRVFRSVDLGFDWRHVSKGDVRARPDAPSLRMYKLHGSLDLLRCPLCGYVYFNPWGSIAHQAFRATLDEHNTCHCSGDMHLELHIVAPCLVREIRDPSLLNVWRSALEWLRQADEWIIAGYSMPPEDLGVRSMFMRAYATARRKPHITVVQKGSADEARFRIMFPECEYESEGLESFLSHRLAPAGG